MAIIRRIIYDRKYTKAIFRMIKPLPGHRSNPELLNVVGIEMGPEIRVGYGLTRPPLPAFKVKVVGCLDSVHFLRR